MPGDFSPSFDCRATAAVLRSGSSAALAGHVAAMMSVLSIGTGEAAVWIKCGSVLAWCATVYLSIRVKMDVSFFELLAGEQNPQPLDHWLDAAGLRRNTGPRTIEERRRGALRLWRALMAALVMQIALMLAGVLTGTFRWLT
jgi:hypothetical protein